MIRAPGLRLAQALSARSRARKHATIMRALAPTSTTTLLDVGVADTDPAGWPSANVLEERYPWPARITALSIHGGESFRLRFPEIRYVQGDGRSLPFADGAFDVAYSNAVIEHFGRGEDQRRFAAELLRVARVAVLGTPNRRFPVEVHTRMPLVHWLPHRWAGPLLARLDPAEGQDLRLLGPRGLAGLFPAGTAVHVVERPLTLLAFASADADAVDAIASRLAGRRGGGGRAGAAV